MDQSRRCRSILFGIWREELHRRKVLYYSYIITRWKIRSKSFIAWKYLLSAISFHKYTHSHPVGSLLATQSVQAWYNHCCELRRKEERYRIAIINRKGYRALERWRNRWIRRNTMERQFHKLRIIRESRTLQTVISAMLTLWKGLDSPLRRAASPHGRLREHESGTHSGIPRNKQYKHGGLYNTWHFCEPDSYSQITDRLWCTFPQAVSLSLVGLRRK